MPTKKAKKTVKKAVKSTKKVVRSTSAPVRRATGNDHDEFFMSNPSIKPLIIVFLLIAAAAFIWILQQNGYTQ